MEADDESILVSISKITVSDRMRKDVNEEKAKEIASSIAMVGLMNPIWIRLNADLKYHLVAGAHRLRAMQINSQTKIQARVVTCTDDEAKAMEITENLHRNELTALERAEHIDEWSRITGLMESAEFSRSLVREAKRISRIEPEAKLAAKKCGIDKNLTNLSRIASSTNQVDAVYKMSAALRAPTEKENRGVITWRSMDQKEREDFLDFLEREG